MTSPKPDAQVTSEKDRADATRIAAMAIGRHACDSPPYTSSSDGLCARCLLEQQLAPALAAARAEGKVEGYREADIEWRPHLLGARAAGYDQGRADGAREAYEEWARDSYMQYPDTQALIAAAFAPAPAGEELREAAVAVVESWEAVRERYRTPNMTDAIAALRRALSAPTTSRTSQEEKP